MWHTANERLCSGDGVSSRMCQAMRWVADPIKIKYYHWLPSLTYPRDRSESCTQRLMQWHWPFNNYGLHLYCSTMVLQYEWFWQLYCMAISAMVTEPFSQAVWSVVQNNYHDHSQMTVWGEEAQEFPFYPILQGLVCICQTDHFPGRCPLQLSKGGLFCVRFCCI